MIKDRKYVNQLISANDVIQISIAHTVLVPDRRCRVVPEVVLVRRGVFGFWEFGGGRVGRG
jgi:8-oxo-dGTP pyrophosphatase MutT (NUDIX family)